MRAAVVGGQVGGASPIPHRGGLAAAFVEQHGKMDAANADPIDGEGAAVSAALYILDGGFGGGGFGGGWHGQ